MTKSKELNHFSLYLNHKQSLLATVVHILAGEGKCFLSFPSESSCFSICCSSLFLCNLKRTFWLIVCFHFKCSLFHCALFPGQPCHARGFSYHLRFNDSWIYISGQNLSFYFNMCSFYWSNNSTPTSQRQLTQGRSLLSVQLPPSALCLGVGHHLFSCSK